MGYRIAGGAGGRSEEEPHVMHRLVTRSDFDGLVCAVLLRHLDLIDDIAFVHPKDVQDGVVEITGRDILTNLPYAPDAQMVFDHHHSERLRSGRRRGEPRDRRRRAVGGPRRLRPLRRRGAVPAGRRTS